MSLDGPLFRPGGAAGYPAEINNPVTNQGKFQPAYKTTKKAPGCRGLFRKPEERSLISAKN
jgi:hypothetical protein